MVLIKSMNYSGFIIFIKVSQNELISILLYLIWKSSLIEWIVGIQEFPFRVIFRRLYSISSRNYRTYNNLKPSLLIPLK